MKKALFAAVVLALLAAGCHSPGTNILLVNNANDPFHPNGRSRLEQGASTGIGSVGHGYAKTVRIERMGNTWATLTITSMYDVKDDESYSVVVTVTEEPYGTFHATSDNSMIDVTVEN